MLVKDLPHLGHNTDFSRLAFWHDFLQFNESSSSKETSLSSDLSPIDDCAVLFGESVTCWIPEELGSLWEVNFTDDCFLGFNLNVTSLSAVIEAIQEGNNVSF